MLLFVKFLSLVAPDVVKPDYVQGSKWWKFRQDEDISVDEIN